MLRTGTVHADHGQPVLERGALLRPVLVRARQRQTRLPRGCAPALRHRTSNIVHYLITTRVLYFSFLRTHSSLG